MRSPLRLLLLLVLLLFGGAGIRADRAEARGGAAAPPPTTAPKTARVPEVSRLTLDEARRRIEGAGFRIGRIESFTPSRTLEIHKVRGVVGYVFSQRPRPGLSLAAGSAVDLRMTATRDGVRDGPPPRAPAAERPARRVPAGEEPRRSLPVPPPPPPPARMPEARTPAPAVPIRAVPTRAVRAPDGPAPEVPAGEAPQPPAPLPLTDTVAQGSPDAPRAAPRADDQVVPTLLGLRLTDAEQLVVDAGMTLYVDRVAGHPIGRVLEQAPSAGGRRPAGGVVRVTVTAGGDFEGEQAPIAPEVYLAKIAVPGLLDRTRLQALRIIEDLGLKAQEEEAKRGLAGRVVDQMPPAGGRVPRGGLVRIWIGPPDPSAPVPASGAPAQPSTNTGRARPDPDRPLQPGPVAPGVPDLPQPGSRLPDAKQPDAGRPDAAQPGTEAHAAPAPKPPLAPGPLRLGIPEPLSPGHGTPIPREESVPVGFTWRGVKGAEAYVLEIEEEGAEGRWLANARKPARKTAVILDVERLSSRGSGRLRWRVTAVSNGREGKPSKWIQLK